MGFSAVNTGNNLLFLVVSGLLAFMSVTGYAGMRNIKGLAPEIVPPAEIFAESAAPFRLRIHNTRRHGASFLVRLECPGGQGVTFPLIGSGDSAEGSIPLTFPDRGHAAIDRLTVSSPFPVNFFTRYWTYATGCNFIVFPRLQAGVTIGDGDEAKRQGGASRHDRGLDGELERISTYSGREPLRMIHWKLSARSEELLVKEFGRQTAPPLVIDLDSLPGLGLEQRISRAAWLVRRWVGLRPVGLRCNGRIIPAETGRHHGRKLLAELALYGRD
ncbi:DUF58 domain-containing protein [Geobacter sp. FeAm09]|uniref:DUF58 domain-containing protein n=1 Tax=Geobacter sp. FeAm09 TaxID=2597769 RepID=UPI001F100A14|nr:DUF58 domain-containing protein [Geobacter sp. FeAm09]